MGIYSNHFMVIKPKLTSADAPLAEENKFCQIRLRPLWTPTPGHNWSHLVTHVTSVHSCHIWLHIVTDDQMMKLYWPVRTTSETIGQRTEPTSPNWSHLVMIGHT